MVGVCDWRGAVVSLINLMDGTVDSPCPQGKLLI